MRDWKKTGTQLIYMGLILMPLGILLSIVALIKGFLLPSLLGIMMVFAGFYAVYVGADILPDNVEAHEGEKE